MRWASSENGPSYSWLGKDAFFWLVNEFINASCAVANMAIVTGTYTLASEGSKRNQTFL
jgi:hypothetical protein